MRPIVLSLALALTSLFTGCSAVAPMEPVPVEIVQFPPVAPAQPSPTPSRLLQRISVEEAEKELQIKRFELEARIIDSKRMILDHLVDHLIEKDVLTIEMVVGLMDNIRLLTESLSSPEQNQPGK